MATAAMIREAARLVETLEDAAIVSFTEIGSEGALLRVNAFARAFLQNESGVWLIARDGTSRVGVC